MKSICFSLIFLCWYVLGQAQSIAVSGQCVTGTVILNKTSDMNGKVAYTGTGTVGGGTATVNIYWLDAPDFVWVLDFDGQPFFTSSCNRSTPPSTTNPNCSWSELTPGSCTGATPLSITGTGTLPVRFLSFTAAKLENQVQLAWSTASETANKGFEVQRSNGNEWKVLGFVNGKGNAATENTYRFEDAAPLQGRNDYRLVQYDFNNNTSYSTVVSVAFSAKGFYTLQHPGNGRYLLTIESATPVELSVVDLGGRKLFGKTVSQGMHPLDLSTFAKGIYLLLLKKDNQVLTEKLIKQ